MDARDGKMHTYENEFMNPNLCETIGPEIGIGYTLSTNNKNPIMLLKSCIGNRSLGWDLLP
jgi:alpha-galactosidase